MNYIYTAPSLNKEICEQIIQRYDAELHLKYHGVTASGLDKSIKDTQDMIIPENEEWDEVNQVLTRELEKHMKLYMESIESGENYKKNNNFGQDYHHLQEKLVQVNNFMIQRYEQNKGKYVYNHDGSNEKKHSRVVTYLWYLNDMVEGGETDFFGGSFKVTPETGKLLLFPACWSFPHRGNMPISSSKYIVTGWLYTENRTLTPTIPKIAVPECKVTILEDTDRVVNEEQKLIFEYFYKLNQIVFLDYKQRVQKNERLFQDFTFPTYTSIMTDWLKKQVQEVTERTDIGTLTEIRPFVISSFKILVDHIKERFHLECHFNINGWYLLYSDTDPFDHKYDLCIQTDLETGDTYVSTEYKELSGYQLVYFIEFTFHYANKDDETKILSLKEVADPCLDLI